MLFTVTIFIRKEMKFVSVQNVTKNHLIDVFRRGPGRGENFARRVRAKLHRRVVTKCTEELADGSSFCLEDGNARGHDSLFLGRARSLREAPSRQINSLISKGLLD